MRKRDKYSRGSLHQIIYTYSGQQFIVLWHAGIALYGLVQMPMVGDAYIHDKLGQRIDRPPAWIHVAKVRSSVDARPLPEERPPPTTKQRTQESSREHLSGRLGYLPRGFHSFPAAGMLR